MEILKRGKLTYYVRDESVIVDTGFQAIAYTVYMLQNRKPFYEFKRVLLASQPDEYDTVVKQITLAQDYKLKGVGTQVPKETNI